MKQLEITKTSIELRYEAIDGTVFIDHKECELYENSAKCVMLSKYVKLIVKSDTEYNIYGVGSEDYTIDVIKFKSENEIDLIMNLFILYNQYCSKDYDRVNKIRAELTKAFRKQQFFFIGRGYEGDTFWPLDSLNNVLEHIVSFCDDSACIEIVDRND